MQIEGQQHEWLNTSECTTGCKKDKENITWCDHCERAFCKKHYEYRNDYDTSETFCEECASILKVKEPTPLTNPDGKKE